MHDYLTEIAREPGVAVRPGGGCSNCASGVFLSDVAVSPVSRGIFSSYPRFNSSRTLTQIFSSVHHVRCLRLEPSTLPVGDDMDYLPTPPAGDDVDDELCAMFDESSQCSTIVLPEVSRVRASSYTGADLLSQLPQI